MSAGWAGARNLLPALALAVVLTGAAAGCGGTPAPDRLLGGSPAARLPLRLEGVSGPALLTAAWAVRPGREGELASCLAETGSRAEGTAVVRVGVSGRTVTAREEGGGRLLGCDRAGGPGEGGRRWCGTPVGRLEAGRLADPRLGIGCRSREGRAVGFAWVEPPPGARYLVAEQKGYAEVYEPQAGLPVRVTTDDVRVEGAWAAFRLSAHDGRGRLLRRWTLEAHVAG